jgi:23S rRNA (uracil1939-C5)-methyltransferase
LSLPVRAGRNGEIQIGFFRKRSHDLVDIGDCMLQAGGTCAKLIAGLKRFMAQSGLTAYSEADKSGDIRHLVCRELDGQTTVTLVVTRGSAPRYLGFKDTLKEIYGESFALWLNENPADTNVILGKEFRFLAGTDKPVTVDGFKTRVHPAGFFQVNDGVRARLYACVSDFIGGERDGTLVEAYAGQGLLAARLCARFKTAYAVEICPESVAAGEEMKKRNGIENLTFANRDCAEWLKSEPQILKNAALILDPPRAGCSPAALEAILENPPKTLVYISCNPATLARDLSRLKETFSVTAAAAFDMFPQTPQVETVVRLMNSE